MTETRLLTDILNFSAAQCNMSYAACKDAADQKLEKCMLQLQDCAIICRITALLIDSNSEKLEQYLNECARICQKCAEECEKHSGIDECLSCALACRNCAAFCTNQLAGISELKYGVC